MHMHKNYYNIHIYLCAYIQVKTDTHLNTYTWHIPTFNGQSSEVPTVALSQLTWSPWLHNIKSFITDRERAGLAPSTWEQVRLSQVGVQDVLWAMQVRVTLQESGLGELVSTLRRGGPTRSLTKTGESQLMWPFGRSWGDHQHGTPLSLSMWKPSKEPLLDRLGMGTLYNVALGIGCRPPRPLTRIGDWRTDRKMHDMTIERFSAYIASCWYTSSGLHSVSGVNLCVQFSWHSWFCAYFNQLRFSFIGDSIALCE